MTCDRASAHAAYASATTPDQQRRLALTDLFYLMVRLLGRKDMDNDWCFARCGEVQAEPDGYLDLWAREHYKSTIITVGKTIQDILANPEITIGIFSHTRPIAKSFLRQIKRELEINDVLKSLFPDVLFASPKREAPQWSEDSGLIVKRSTNPKEATVEAWGLEESPPVGKHFSLLVYDDVVTRESVTTPEMIAKITDAWAHSLNLGAHGGVRRIIGTRYHFNDTYKTILDRGAAVPRIYEERHMVSLSIEDNGPGLTPEEHERLFEPYYSHKTGGTGLGLAIVLSIIKDHQGGITAATVPGGGTVFVMLFPVYAASQILAVEE